MDITPEEVRRLYREHQSWGKVCIALGIHPEGSYLRKWRRKHMPGETAATILSGQGPQFLEAPEVKPPAPMPVSEKIIYERQLSSTKAQLSDVTQKYRAAQDALEQQELLISAAERCISALPPVAPPCPVSVAQKRHEEIAVLDLSDLHIGEVVRSNQIMGLNEYNPLIFTKRMQQVVDSIASIKAALSGYDLRHLEVHALGDIVSGIIHEELVSSAEDTVMEWVINGSFVIAQALAELLTIFETIHFVGVVGNHGRLSQKKSFKNRYVNWDYLSYQIIALMMVLNSDRITFEIPQSFFTLRNVGGRNTLLVHGDDIQSWNGIPWYGIGRAVKEFYELMSLDEIFIDDVKFGHFHTTGDIENIRGELMINGSMIGGNEYSIGKMRKHNKPHQRFYGVNPTDKRKTWQYKLDVWQGDAIEHPRYEYSTSFVAAQSVRERIPALLGN